MNILKLLAIYALSFITGGIITLFLVEVLFLFRNWLASTWPNAFGNIGKNRGNEREKAYRGIDRVNYLERIQYRLHTNAIAVLRVIRVYIRNSAKSISNKEGNSKAESYHRDSKPLLPIHSVHRIHRLSLLVIGFGTGTLFAGIIGSWDIMPTNVKVILLLCLVFALDVCGGISLDTDYTNDKHETSSVFLVYRKLWRAYKVKAKGGGDET